MRTTVIALQLASTRTAAFAATFAATCAATLACALAVTAGCDKAPSTPTTAGAAAPSAGASAGASTADGKIDASVHCEDGTGIQGLRLPDGLVVRAAATDAVPAGTCKANAKLGDKVTVVGRIGGSRVPFVASRAMFTIVDPSLKSCADMDEPDHCSMPWDYCCEPRENLKRNSITIEIVGADGKLLPFSVSGADGLKPLATVAVTGTVSERNDEGLFVVRAEKIAIQ